jgi:U3 small nucleolar RNA-associated protein 7
METDVVAETSLKTQPDKALAFKSRNERRERSEQKKLQHIKDAQKSYGRGSKIDVKRIQDKKLRHNLKALEDKFQNAAIRAKDAEILLENESGFLEPEHELEKTYKVRQDQIVKDVAVDTAQKKFDLKLDALGPYVFEYTRNGREILLAGRKGHVATMDWREGKLGCELQLNETVRDARWLHNNQYFAVAQKTNVYIYDSQGVELHSLTKHKDVNLLEFLPYHFLLTTMVSSQYSYSLCPRNHLLINSERD